MRRFRKAGFRTNLLQWILSNFITTLGWNVGDDGKCSNAVLFGKNLEKMFKLKFPDDRKFVVPKFKFWEILIAETRKFFDVSIFLDGSTFLCFLFQGA